MADLQTMRAIVAKADNPDVAIQVKLQIGKWVDDGSSIEALTHCAELYNKEYRIKPQTITLNAVELPKPINTGYELNFDAINDVVTLTVQFHNHQDSNEWFKYFNSALGCIDK